MASTIMTSCSKENIDNENLDPEDVEVVVEETQDETCDNMLTITSDVLNFSNIGKAQLFKPQSCNGDTSLLPLIFNIVDVEWDSWGSTPNEYHATDGIPGIAFGTTSDAEVGDDAYLLRNLVGSESLIYFDSLSTYYTLVNDYTFTLTEIGDEVGEFIGGNISGEIISENENDGHPFEISFCVPITFVCD